MNGWFAPALEGPNTSCVLKAVNLGGGTDTIAAIAGGLAGILYGETALPEAWGTQLAASGMIDDLCKKAAEAWGQEGSILQYFSPKERSFPHPSCVLRTQAAQRGSALISRSACEQSGLLQNGQSSGSCAAMEAGAPAGHFTSDTRGAV